MYNYIWAGILCVIMLVPTAAWATHPFVVQDTATEGKGNFLLELTDDYVYVKEDQLRATKETAIITAGASRHVDLSLELPYLIRDPSPITGKVARGIGDIRIKLHHQLFENEVKQSMAYQIYAYLPTGNDKKGFGMDDVIWGVTLIDTQECHSNAFHMSVGYEMRWTDMKDVNLARNYIFKFGFAAEHKFTNSFRLLAEIAGESRKETDEATNTQSYSGPFTVLAGFIYDLSKSWYVDLGGRYGLNKYAEDYSVRAGTAWRF